MGKIEQRPLGDGIRNCVPEIPELSRVDAGYRVSVYPAKLHDNQLTEPHSGVS